MLPKLTRPVLLLLACAVVIPAAGHMANLERPAEFNDAVRAFCLAHPLT